MFILPASFYPSQAAHDAEFARAAAITNPSRFDQAVRIAAIGIVGVASAGIVPAVTSLATREEPQGPPDHPSRIEQESRHQFPSESLLNVSARLLRPGRRNQPPRGRFPRRIRLSPAQISSYNRSIVKRFRRARTYV